MTTFTVRRSIINILILMTGAFQSPLAACPPGWVAWQDACYIFLPQRMNWWEASKVCDRPGSSLVVPDSQEEQDFIWQEIQMRMEEFGETSDEVELWIGCKKIDTNLTCGSENTNPNFNNWNDIIDDESGQSDESDESDESDKDLCVRMAKIDGKWEDCDCGSNKFVACEMRVSPRAYCLQADSDGRFTPQCLRNHEIKYLTDVGVVGCGQACWAEPRCRSFNIWQSADETKACQLNDVHRPSDDVTDDIKPMGNCIFFEL